MVIQNYAQAQNRVDELPPVSDVVDQSSFLRASRNQRKRGRKESAAAAAADNNSVVFSRGLASVLPSSTLVNNNNPVAPASCQFLREFINAPYLKNYLADVDANLRAQNEQLRRTMLEKWQRQSRTLLLAVEVAAARRIREKEALAEQAMRQCAELKQQLALSRVASASWQARIVAAEHSAASLRAQLEQALAVAAEGTGESGGDDDDAKSAHAEPSGLLRRSCLVCRRANSAVVAVVPCGHLCLCADCSDGGDVLRCPCCGGVRDGAFRVVFC